MNRKLIAILIANLFVAPVALAADDFKVEGWLGVGGIVNNDEGRNAAKLNEYQDVDSGASFLFDVKGRGNRYWLDAYGENIGRDDLYARVKGGQYGTFKYDVYANWLTHNFKFDALSPYTTPGSAAQLTTTAPSGNFPNANVASWTRFDAGYDRRDYGGAIEWNVMSNWWVRAGANQYTFDGNKLMSPSQGTSPGNGFVDLAVPIDYKTTNIVLEGGYTSKQLVGSLQVLFSQFDNDNETISFKNGYFGNGIDTYTLPGDNDFFKVSGNVAWRNLAWNSTLAARFTYSDTTSDVSVLPTMQNSTVAGGVLSPTGASSPNFNGEEKITSASLSWALAPTRETDGRVYYNFYDRKNESNHISFVSPLPQPTGGNLNCGTQVIAGVTVPIACETEFFDVKKNNFGVEGAYRFARGFKLSGGWDWLKKDQERVDYDEVTENRFFAELKSTFDLGVARVKYQYAKRDGNFIEGNAGTGPTDPLYLQRFVGKYDSSDRTQNMVKVQFDFMPADMVDLGAEFIWKSNDYTDTVLGRLDDQRSELYLSAGFGDPKTLRVSVFGDLERVTYDSYHRAISALTAPGAYDPNTAPTASNFNWSAKNEDSNYAFGAAANWPVLPNLMLVASALYTKTDGSADFSSQNNFGTPLPISAYDDTEKTTLNLKAIWSVSKQIELTGGYAWEKFEYSDLAYNNYQNLAPPPPGAITSTTSYLSGIYAYPDYRASIFYVIGKYKF